MSEIYQSPPQPRRHACSVCRRIFVCQMCTDRMHELEDDGTKEGRFTVPVRPKRNMGNEALEQHYLCQDCQDPL